jgi:hypothetical protein
VVEQVRGEGMAQHMRRNLPLRDAGVQRIFFDQRPEHLPRHAGAALGDENRIGCLRAKQVAARLGEIAFDGAQGRLKRTAPLPSAIGHGPRDGRVKAGNAVADRIFAVQAKMDELRG